MMNELYRAPSPVVEAYDGLWLEMLENPDESAIIENVTANDEATAIEAD